MNATVRATLHGGGRVADALQADGVRQVFTLCGVDLAARIAGNARRWWRNSRMGLNRVVPLAHFDRLGVPRFS